MVRRAPHIPVAIIVTITHVSAVLAGGLSPFTEEAGLRGLNYTIQSPPSDGYLGFGCGLIDLDGDHDPDAVILGAADGRVGIFENLGHGQFVDRSMTSGIPILREASGMAAGDYDGDGLLDLYLTQYEAPSVLARNLGGMTFVDVAQSAGVDESANSKGAAFGDYDGDGFIDLYVVRYTGKGPGSNRLFHNLGDGTFDDVSVAQGVDDDGSGFQPLWFDYDRDGDVDLYLSNDRGHFTGFPNQLWRNDAGILVNVSAKSGADDGFFSMGLACGDLDGNGYGDLYCTNISTQSTDDIDGVFPLYLNQGDGSFIESAVAAGVDALGIGTGWGGVFFDYDNDSLLDLYVNIQFAPNRLFTGLPAFPMSEIAGAANCAGGVGQSFSAAVGDVDADGDLDLLMNNLSGPAQLFINNEGEKRNWIRMRMVGRDENTAAIGGLTETSVGTDTHLREIFSGGNTYLGQNELVMHIGLDDAVVADEILASWPGGAVTRVLTNLPANRTWLLYSPDDLGDANRDHVVNAADFMTLAGCLDQVFEPGCEIMDFDGDSAVDAEDLAAFLAAHDGPLPDCNNNGTNDFEDILADPGLDQDDDGTIDSCPACISFSDCADVDGNGIRDDGCVWWACSDICDGTDVVFADMGGQFGSCAPDGAADGNDRFHALNCFANVDPGGVMGRAYTCEADAPSALNVDAGGQFGDCSPDGVCDGNDAFHALNAFAGASMCMCPLDGAPAPSGVAVRGVTERGGLRLVTTTPSVAPGERTEVDVFLLRPLEDLRGYQLHVRVSGGTRGTLELTDISIDSGAPRVVSGRRPVVPGAHVFSGVIHWEAFNLSTRQMVAGLDGSGQAVGPGYLATFAFRATADAAGTFAVELLHDEGEATHRTFLFPTPAQGRIVLEPTLPLEISVRH